MQPEQLDVARHALGLPNNKRMSYRNSFVTGEESSDHAIWMALVQQGYARRFEKPKGYGGMDAFLLTPTGAKAALKDGERLDPEDFPAAA